MHHDAFPPPAAGFGREWASLQRSCAGDDTLFVGALVERLQGCPHPASSARRLVKSRMLNHHRQIYAQLIASGVARAPYGAPHALFTVLQAGGDDDDEEVICATPSDFWGGVWQE